VTALAKNRITNRIDLLEIVFPPLALIRWRASFGQFLKRAIARQYRTHALGALWVIMVPLITLGIYTFVFGTVMRSRWDGAMTQSGQNIPFALYLFAGLIVVGLMSQSAIEACGAIVGHANLVKKAVFPLEIIPLTSVGNAVFHALINTAILLIAMVFTLGSVPLTALLFPVVLLPFVVLVAGLAWFLSAVGVFFRDLNNIIGLAMTGILFLSPVFYSVSHLSPHLQTVVAFNPVTVPVMAARAVLLEGHMPDWAALGRYTIIAWIIASLGLLFFRQVRKSFADVL
jgi:lipopolysaccharide transport system permease protein